VNNNETLSFMDGMIMNKNETATKIDFVSCTFIKKERTADYQTAFSLRQTIKNEANSIAIWQNYNTQK
jgi:hypothetical protein